MSIASAITAAQGKVTDAYTAISNKGGTLPATQNLSNMPTAISSIPTGGGSPVLRTYNVTPTTSAQAITPPYGVDGYNLINVSAVTSSIDGNIQAANIKRGVTILGVTGEVDPFIPITISSLNVTPTTSSQHIVPPEGSMIDGYSPIEVAAVDASIDANIAAGNIKNGVTILGVTGSVTELVGSTLIAPPRTTEYTYTPTAPSNGFTSVKVSAVDNTIDANITSSNIKSGVTILGVTGDVVELNGETRTVSLTSFGQVFTPTSGKNAITSITVNPSNLARTVTPSTSQQSIGVPTGFSGNGTITVNAVDSTIDANIVAGNIRSGATILGVTGTYTGTSTRSIQFEVSGGVLVNSTTAPLMDFSGVTTIDRYYMFNKAYYNNTTVAGVLDLSSITTVSGPFAFLDAFAGTPNVTGVDMSSLTTVSGNDALDNMFYNSGVTTANFSGLTSVTGKYAFRMAFSHSQLSSIDLSSLSVVTGSAAFLTAFSLSQITSLSFPALTTTSFGSNTNQFSGMCNALTGVTLHFPSNIQSVIEGLDGYSATAPFGATSGTVLFDLPATT